jgi:hypothetical protein
MYLVIQTQHRENYAWDEYGNLGVGEDAYWKNKGGDTYIIQGVTIDQSMDKSFYSELYDMIQYSDDGFEEFIIGEDLVDDMDFVESNYVQEWESPIYITYDGTQFNATKTTINDMMFRKEIAKKVDTWIMKSRNTAFDNCGFTKFKSDLHLVDGRVMNQSEFLEEISSC